MQLTGAELQYLDASIEDGGSRYEKYLDCIVESSQKVTQIGEILDQLGEVETRRF